MRSNWVWGLSLSSRATEASTSRLTIQVGWSSPSWGRMLPAGNLARTASSSCTVEVSGGASVDTFGLLLVIPLIAVLFAETLAVAGHLLLELEEAVDQPLRRRRAAGDVHVHRDDLVDALHHVIGAIEAARAGAGAHRDDPLRLRHLVVDLLQHRAHLVVDGARHQQHVALPGREAHHLGAEPRQVVVARHGGHELDRAAGRAERERPEGVARRPVLQRVERRGDPAFSSQAHGQSSSRDPQSTTCDWRSQALVSRIFLRSYVAAAGRGLPAG